MPTITSAGIGSGIDIQSIIDGLMTVERRPLDIIQFRREEIGVRISGYGELLASVSTFNSATESLSSLDSLSLFKTSSSDDGVVEISSTDEPATGNYSVEVSRIAEAHKTASGEFLSSVTIGGTAGDSLDIQVGADIMNVDLSTAATLETIRDSINDNEDNPGVSAAIINGDGGNQKLVLTSDETGSDNEILLSYGGTLTAGSFNFTTVNDISGDINNLNSEIIIDGYTISRQSNSISDVIDGITIKLNDADPGSTKTISVARDDGEAEKKISGFADAYNDLTSSLDSLRSGSLASDSILLSVENQIRSALNSFKSGGTYSSLSEIGLTIQREGNMTLDAEKLQTVLADGIGDVAELFAEEGSGFAWRLENLTSQWIGTGGLLNQRTVRLGEQIDSLADDQLRIQRNLEIIEARYVQQFASLDSLVASFQSTSTFLNSQLSQISNLTNNDR